MKQPNPQASRAATKTSRTATPAKQAKIPRAALDRDGFLLKMKAHILQRHKTASAAAKSWNCTAAFVSAVMNKNRPPNQAMLQAVGYAKREFFVPVESLQPDLHQGGSAQT